MSNIGCSKITAWVEKNYFFFHNAMQEVIYLDPFSPIKPWEVNGRSGKAELSLQEIKHEMKTSSSYSALSSQAPVSHSRPLIKWCPVSVLKDEFWLCSYIQASSEESNLWPSGKNNGGGKWRERPKTEVWVLCERACQSQEETGIMRKRQTNDTRGCENNYQRMGEKHKGGIA